MEYDITVLNSYLLDSMPYQNVCNGENVDIYITGSPSVPFTYVHNQSGSIGIANSGNGIVNGSPLSFTAVNNTSQVIAVNFSFTVTNGYCGYTTPFMLYIYPTP